MIFNKSLIIKPAGADCNFSCDYCFYLRKSELYPNLKKHRMSLVVLEEMIKQVIQASGKNVGFIWQGGEPTLMGIDFFLKVVEFQQKYGKGQVVSNAFQTNGWLINEDWARLFHKYKFLVGLSIDGEDFIHDRFRKTAGNGKTFEKVWQTANLLRKFNVEFNVLSMVNSESVEYPEKIFNFFLRNNIVYMQFIPIVEYDDKGEIADFSVSPSEYGDFLCRLFDLWYNNGHPYVSVRDFDSLIHREVRGKCTVCIYDNQCGQHVVVEHNGDVYACDFFVELKWKYGNLIEIPLPELVLSKKCEEFTNLKMNLNRECFDCKWLGYCYGGCQKFRGIKGDTENKFYFCESYKEFFEYSVPKVKKLARIIKDSENRDRDYEFADVEKKVGRNEPCPCGSGLKYKHCCGRIV